MKTLLKALAGLVTVLVVVLGCTFVWAKFQVRAQLARTFDTHRVDFPIPFPLTESEIVEAVAASGGNPLDLQALARERALERGRHLVESRYVCTECHGTDFGGGVMVDDPMIGQLLGPNITAGAGGRTASYQPADWDRIVRHGVRPDGTPAVMPSEDFVAMTDQELSDIVLYVRSHPTVADTVAPVRLGPLGTLLAAFGQLPLAADKLPNHSAPHEELPPVADVSVAFGAHLSGVCVGCHGPTLAGGPIAGGDPSWLPAANLTPHEDGLAAWSYSDFANALRKGTRPDGTELRMPMSLAIPYTGRMTDVEVGALWEYLRSLPPQSGN